jgi:hypothetical protein
VLTIRQTYEGGIGESSRHESHGKSFPNLHFCDLS